MNLTSKTFCNIPAPIHIRPPDQMSYMACCFEQGHSGDCVYGVKSLMVVSIPPTQNKVAELEKEITRLRIEREWKDLEMVELKSRIASMTEQVERLRVAGDALAEAANAGCPSTWVISTLVNWHGVRHMGYINQSTLVNRKGVRHEP